MKVSRAFVGVPEFVTDADVPGNPVVVLATATVELPPEPVDALA